MRAVKLSCFTVSAFGKEKPEAFSIRSKIMEREEITYLFDIYGSLLTENMQNCIDLYYNEDYSLSEIAENLKITRQGVRDTIQRGIKQLKRYDEVLNLHEHYTELSGAIDEIIMLSDEIKEVNSVTALSRDINDAATRINTIAQLLKQ